MSYSKGLDTYRGITTKITMRNTAYWVEIPATNFERAIKFYETIFAVEMYPVPMPRGKYAIFPLDMDAKGAGGAVVEGADYKPSDNAEKGPITYLDRDEDLSIPLSRVEKAGGKVLLGKTKNGANGEFGFIAHILDSEGNRMGLHSNI
jgi:predicted enzyme related to lactoylglutathione lyase